MVAKAAENFSRLPVVWLHFANAPAALKHSCVIDPNVDDILLETISLEYHETLIGRFRLSGRKEPGRCVKLLTASLFALLKALCPRSQRQVSDSCPKGKNRHPGCQEVATKAAALFVSDHARLMEISPQPSPTPQMQSASAKAIGINSKYRWLSS